MNICIQICGHTRNFLNLYENINNNLLIPNRQHNIDIFACTYKDTNTKDSAMFERGKTICDTPAPLTEIVSKLNPKQILVLDNNQYDPIKLSQVNGISDRANKIILGQLYCFHLCAKLRKIMKICL